MKGLVLTNMHGKRDEGVELVRKGLALGLESHICWHVYGLVLKQEKNYAQALGAYSRALKYDVVSSKFRNEYQKGCNATRFRIT
jgi:peptide alpha-N-acetyltransferase